MKILQIEDKEEYKIKDADVVETFEEAKQKMKQQDYGIFIIDGNFPLIRGGEPGINVKPAVEYIKKRSSGRIIVWTNSIRAQKYCEENNILCFSKNEKTEEHVEKMKKYGLKEYCKVKKIEDIMPQ